MRVRARQRRRPMAWSVAMLDELEGAGVDDRRGQARAMNVSLPHIDRLRKALRDEHREGTPPRQRAPKAAEAAEPVQLGVRVPASVVARLQRHAARMGVSMAVLVTVALHDWLAAHDARGPSPLTRKEREALGL